MREVDTVNSSVVLERLSSAERQRLIMSGNNYMREQNCAASGPNYCQGGRKDFLLH